MKKLYLYRRLLWDMTMKQLKTKYSGSKLGIWWAIITPLILAVSINFIFTKVFKIEMQNHTLFVLSGMIPWIFFSSTLSEVTNSFVASGSILKQAIFPRELIPLSVILGNFLNFLIGLAILLPLFIILKLKVIAVLFFVIIPLFTNLTFLIGLGFIFSCGNVFSKDLPHLLSIGLMLWFWITPVFYSIDRLEFPYRWICLFNPMSYYVISYQQILFLARAPEFLHIVISVLISLFFLVFGYAFFLKKEPLLLKRI